MIEDRKSTRLNSSHITSSFTLSLHDALPICLLEHRLAGLPVRLGHLTDEIGDRRAKRELRAVGILKPQLVVADDPSAVQDATGLPRARSERSVDIDDRRSEEHTSELQSHHELLHSFPTRRSSDLSS